MFYEKPEWKEEAEVARTSIPDFYTASELARLCGFASKSYIARLCCDNKIYSYKLGTYRLIPEHEVERFVKGLKERY